MSDAGEKVGKRAVLREHENLVQKCWGLRGVIEETREQPVTTRDRPNGNVVQTGTVSEYYVRFDPPPEDPRELKGLWLPEEMFRIEVEAGSAP